MFANVFYDEQQESSHVTGNEDLLTWKKFEGEVVASWVGMTWTAAATRQPKLERWTVRRRVPVNSANLDDGVSRLTVFADDRMIIDGKLRVVVIDVH